MDWDKLIEKYDRKNVIAWMRTFPEQIAEAVYIGRKFRPKKRKVEKIVACGMGGSGVGAAILRDWLKKELTVPFEVFNSYTLPAYVDSRTLVLCISFSGNTEETIACFREAKRKKAYVIGVTKNGMLRKMAGKNCLFVPNASPQPRMGLAYMLMPLLVALESMKLIKSKNSELTEAFFLLKKESRPLEAKARELALKMRGKLPIIYAPEELTTLTYRFRKEVNENSKQFLLNNYVPEQNHNEISVRFGLKKKDCGIFLLRHENEYSRVSRRFSVLKKIMGGHFRITEVNLKGKSLIAVTLYGLQLAALTSYYLALLNGLDPEPVPDIAVLKKALKG